MLILFACRSVLGSFTVSGQIVADYDSINYHLKAPFRASVDGGRWQIKVQFKDYTEFAWSDGVQISSFMLYPPNPVDKSLSPAKLLPGRYPFFSDPSVRLVWLAYASSEYLAVNTNTMPNLAIAGFLDPLCEAYEIRDLKVLNNPEALLPSEMDFVLATRLLSSRTNMHYLSKTISTLKLERAASDLKKYNNSLDSHYEVTAVTNWNGMALPLEFQFQVFNFVNTNTGLTRAKFQGNLTAIAAGAIENEMPVLNYPIWVNDFRFSDVAVRIDSIGYTVTNNNWPAASDSQLQTIFSRKKAALLSDPNFQILSETNQRLLPRIFMLFVILSLPVLILLRWLRKGKTNTPLK